jgi:hypothetical protein
VKTYMDLMEKTIQSLLKARFQGEKADYADRVDSSCGRMLWNFNRSLHTFKEELECVQQISKAWL